MYLSINQSEQYTKAFKSLVVSNLMTQIFNSVNKNRLVSGQSPDYYLAAKFKGDLYGALETFRRKVGLSLISSFT